MIRKKILLLGDFNVGKTSLIRRYVDDAFDDTYLSTIGVKISKKMITIKQIECEILIWDIEGATPTKEIPLNYYKGASGAIIVTDVNRSETQKSLQMHQNIFLAQNPEAFMVVAHNKVDLLSSRQKESFSLNKNSFFTSAKEDYNVRELFLSLSEKMLFA